MWEFKCHDWKKLQGVETLNDVPLVLNRLMYSIDEVEWQGALRSLEAYASDLGIPSNATKAVVACLVAIAIRTEGQKRTEVLGTLEELTCGRGIEAYSLQQLAWLRGAVRELAGAFHLWAQLAESAPAEDAILCIQLLAYCAVNVPEVELRVLNYLEQCSNERPELGDDISALLINFNNVKELLKNTPTI